VAGEASMNDDTMDLTPMADIVGEMAAPEIAEYLSKADAEDPGMMTPTSSAIEGSELSRSQ
jgi:hypothetical protein